MIIYLFLDIYVKDKTVRYGRNESYEVALSGEEYNKFVGLMTIVGKDFTTVELSLDYD